jgi:hypothetical protein
MPAPAVMTRPTASVQRALQRRACTTKRSVLLGLGTQCGRTGSSALYKTAKPCCTLLGRRRDEVDRETPEGVVVAYHRACWRGLQPLWPGQRETASGQGRKWAMTCATCTPAGARRPAAAHVWRPRAWSRKASGARTSRRAARRSSARRCPAWRPWRAGPTTPWLALRCAAEAAARRAASWNPPKPLRAVLAQHRLTCVRVAAAALTYTGIPPACTLHRCACRAARP